MVGINEILSGIAKRLHGSIRLCTGGHRLGVHDLVLTVGLVPHRHEVNPELLLSLEKGLEL